MGEAIVFTSGKGGVGKTTTIANIGAGLSQLDKKVIMLDTDMGLRNLDVVMGLEDRITYNLLDLLDNKCRLNQALIRDKRFPNLYMIPASLRCHNIGEYSKQMAALIEVLKTEFDFCLIDCPAGIDEGFEFAVSAADRAIVVTTPHISAIRDAGRVLYLLEAYPFMKKDLIINEVNDKMIRKHEMMSQKDIEAVLGMKSIGTIPVDKKIIISQNMGVPVISMRCSARRNIWRIVRNIQSSKPHPVDLEKVEEQEEVPIGSFSGGGKLQYEVES